MPADGVLLHRLGERRRYRFTDATCLGAQCFQPAVMTIQTDYRGQVDGSVEISTCAHRAKHGCPVLSARDITHKAIEHRRTAGWREE